MRIGLAAVLVFLGTFAGLTIAGVTPAGASTLDGAATIANPDGDTPLASGGSADPLHGDPPGQRLLRRRHREQRLPRLQLPDAAGNRPDLGVVQDGVPFDGLRVSRRRPAAYYGKANTATTTGEIIGIPGDLSSHRCSQEG